MEAITANIATDTDIIILMDITILTIILDILMAMQLLFNLKKCQEEDSTSTQALAVTITATVMSTAIMENVVTAIIHL